VLQINSQIARVCISSGLTSETPSLNFRTGATHASPRGPAPRISRINIVSSTSSAWCPVATALHPASRANSLSLRYRFVLARDSTLPLPSRTRTCSDTTGTPTHAPSSRTSSKSAAVSLAERMSCTTCPITNRSLALETPAVSASTIADESAPPETASSVRREVSRFAVPPQSSRHERTISRIARPVLGEVKSFRELTLQECTSRSYGSVRVGLLAAAIRHCHDIVTR